MMKYFWNVCDVRVSVILSGAKDHDFRFFGLWPQNDGDRKNLSHNVNVQLIIGMLLLIQIFSINFLWAQEESQNSKASARQQQNFVYDDHGKRDPFWTLVTPTGVIVNYDSDVLISDMVLEGIIAGADGKNLAIINNTIVKPNDQFGLFVIEKIELDKVLLRKGQESFALKIKKEE